MPSSRRVKSHDKSSRRRTSDKSGSRLSRKSDKSGLSHKSRSSKHKQTKTEIIAKIMSWRKGHNVKVTSPSGIVKFSFTSANKFSNPNRSIKRIDKYGLHAVELWFDAKFKNESSYRAALRKPIRLAGIDLDWYISGAAGSYDRVDVALSINKN